MLKRKQFISFAIPRTPSAQENSGEAQSGVEHINTQPLFLGSSLSIQNPPRHSVPPGQTTADSNWERSYTRGSKSRGHHALEKEQRSLFSPFSRPKKHTKRRRRWLTVVAALLLIFILVVSQGNGTVGAWSADAFRALFGATATAQIEAWYLQGTDWFSRLGYQLSGRSVAAPWSVGTPPISGTRMARSSPSGSLFPMDLPQITPQVLPALAGEGTWLPQIMAPAPDETFPLAAKTFYRPDPSHPYAVVTLQQFDIRFLLLHMVAGTSEPGGPRGARGPGMIPAGDQQGNTLLAAFNGGFKYADGQYGMAVGGKVYVPAQPGAATLAVTKEGHIIMGAWGVDPRLNGTNPDLVAWRQNASLLINQGVINPLTHDGAAWGGTILNRAYTWRSGIGITKQGMLIYAAGNALTAETLADALQAAGAVMAMQTDINPFWVRSFLYQRNVQGVLSISKLNPAMQGNGTEYLKGTTRDFLYLTRLASPINQGNG